jgi:hypothetical protein
LCLRRVLQLRLNHKTLKSLNLFSGQPLRAAGALAGVVLERHLQRVAGNHRVLPSKKNPTIADLNDPLREAGVYELPTWRKIQLMADIRNLCTHQKSVEPTTDQVNELIAGANTIIKTVF